jgi:hypothetical protein
MALAPQLVTVLIADQRGELLMFFRSSRGVALNVALSVVVVGALSFLFVACAASNGSTSQPTAHSTKTPSAPQPPAVVITSHITFTSAPTAPNGTFSATGVVCPEGKFVDTPETLPSPDLERTVLVSETYTCKDGSGTFTIRFIAHETANQYGPETWQVVSGAGSLATLQGSGTMTSVDTGNDTATVTYTGTMYIALS